MSGRLHERLVLLYGRGTCPRHRTFISLLTLSEGKGNTNSAHKHKLLYSCLAEHACLDGLAHGHFLFVLDTGTSQGSESAGTPSISHSSTTARDIVGSSSPVLATMSLFPLLSFYQGFDCLRKQTHTCASTHMHMNETYNCSPEMRADVLDILFHRVR